MIGLSPAAARFCYRRAMTSRFRLLAFLVAAAMCLAPVRGHAHSQVQAARELAVTPDGKRWSVALPSGLLRSDDGGKTFRWQCTVAFGSGGKLGLQRRVFPHGSGFAMVDQAKLMSTADGCSWKTVFDGGVVAGSERAGALWVVRSDGGKTRIHRAESGGKFVDVTPSGSGGWRHVAAAHGSTQHAIAIAVSGGKTRLAGTSDGGKSWQDRAAPNDHGLEPLGWHPKTDVVVLRGSGDDGERLWTAAGNGAWKKHVNLAPGDPLRAAVWLPNAGTEVLLVAGHEARILRSVDGGASFAHIKDAPHAPCLRVVAGGVIACSDNLLDKGLLSRSDDAGLTWKSMMCLGKLPGAVTCGPSQPVCENLWKLALLDARAVAGTCDAKPPPRVDAASSSSGGSDASASGSGGSSTSSSGGGSSGEASSGGVVAEPPASDDGCSASCNSDNLPGVVVLMLVAGLLVARRRRFG